MADAEKPEYIINLHGLRNGKPHEIIMDVRETIGKLSLYRDEVLTDEELEMRSAALYTDHQRLQAVGRRAQTESSAPDVGYTGPTILEWLTGK